MDAERGGSGSVSQRYPLALLILLATAPDRTLSRSKLAGLLWPDVPESTARSRLNTHVYRIRAGLGDDVLVSVVDDLRLNPDALRCDVWRFESAVERDEPAAAVEEYGGPFLDGFKLSDAPEFEKRMERLRGKLRASYHRALEKMGEAAEERSDPEEAVRWWYERAAADPYDGRVVLRLMRVLSSAGNRAAAIRVARDYARRMRDELGLEPSAEVRRLAERLREDREPVPSTVLEEDGERSTTSEPARPREPEVASNQGGTGGSAPRISGRVETMARGRTTRVLVALSVLAVVGATTFYAVSGATEVGSGPVPASIAVLPFVPLGEEAPDGIADAIHVELLTRLAQVPDLDVVSSASVQQHRVTDSRAAGVARELGVRWILEGAVQRSGDRIQVNAQLTDSRTETHVWARSYRRELSAVSLIEMQADLTRRIARTLEVTLTTAAERRLARPPTEDLGAYDLYLRARAHEARTATGLSDLREVHQVTLRLLDRALERDSAFAEAWSRKTRIHLHAYRLSGGESDAHLRAARSAAARAWMADPDGPWGHLARAELLRLGEEEPEGALAHYEATGIATAEVMLSRAKSAQALGRMREAVRLFERARVLDPRDPEIPFQSWWAYGLLGRYEDAAAALDRTLELAPDHFGARLHRARLPLLAHGDAAAVGPPADDQLEVLWRLGDHEGALAAAPKSRVDVIRLPHRVRRALVFVETGDSAVARAMLKEVRGELEAAVARDSEPTLLAALAKAHAGLGDRARALAAMQAAREHADRPLLRNPKRLDLAIVYALLGEEDAMIATLEDYLEGPGLCSVRCVSSHPLFSRFREDPRFSELERRFGMEEQGTAGSAEERGASGDRADAPGWSEGGGGGAPAASRLRPSGRPLA